MDVLTFFIIGLIVCFGAFALLLIGGVVLIFFLGKGVVGPARQRQVRSLVEDWAREHDYELLEIGDLDSRDHPFADRFGFGFGKTPGIVKCITMKDPRGRVRRGWVYFKGRLTARGGYSGIVPESLEIAWGD